MSAPEPIIAKKDLPTRCCVCGCRIDHGDRYVILRGIAGFDYEHVNCETTEFKGHLERSRP